MRATVAGSGEDLPLSHLPTACWVTPRRIDEELTTILQLIDSVSKGSTGGGGDSDGKDGVLLGGSSTVRCRTAVFKTASLNHSDISPRGHPHTPYPVSYTHLTVNLSRKIFYSVEEWQIIRKYLNQEIR